MAFVEKLGVGLTIRGGDRRREEGGRGDLSTTTERDFKYGRPENPLK